jgi:hypothetical protein
VRSLDGDSFGVATRLHHTLNEQLVFVHHIQVVRRWISRLLRNNVTGDTMRSQMTDFHMTTEPTAGLWDLVACHTSQLQVVR